MRLGLGFVAWVACAGACVAETPYERAVLDALNTARTDPARYAEDLRVYRKFFHAKLVRLPGQKVYIETAEGVAVVDETIAFLGKQNALMTLQPAPILGASARDHVTEQSETGATGHDGDDGSTPGDRVVRHGGGRYVAEVIAYGPIDAADAVRQLIVDDGVEDRGHRAIIFSPELRFAGVSCGAHPEYRTMCVIDMGMTADARVGGGTTRASAP